MSITLLSDCHIGLNRKAGATSQSMSAYTTFQQQILLGIKGDELLIAGDLFNSEDVDYEDLLFTIGWLMQYSQVTVLQGNHDIHPNRSKLSSLDFMEHVVPNIKIIRKLEINGDVAYVPHLANQEEFNQAIAEAAKAAKILVTHCNYNNPFMYDKDHSLNLTPEQSVLFDTVISGHEHNYRSIGNVIMLGSPYPCNIAECFNKYTHTWDDKKSLKKHLTWSDDNYKELDWRSLEATEHQFIRIVGEATADETASVLQEVSRFRAKSSAFMITNSVKNGALEIGELDEATTNLETFDPIAVLKSILSDDHRKHLEEVMK